MPTRKLSPYTHFQLLIRTLLVALIAATFVGCEKPKIGGGSRSIISGSNTNEVVFGIREGEKLGFVIFTDFPSDGTVSSAGSTWAGTIAPKSGKTVAYKGSKDGMVINGVEYDFEKGRVFLVSNTHGISQLDVTIEEKSYGDEIDRIGATEDVQTFLNQ